MAEISERDLSGTTESLLVTLYLRAVESQRPDALIKDDKAVELVSRMNYDFARMRLLHLIEANKLVIILRSREIDRRARDFLARHPDAVVVHIGCGLDARFNRVDNGQVEWYDLDLPNVVSLRCRLMGGGEGRYHLAGCSVLEQTWVESVKTRQGRPVLILAEGVFMYLQEAEVKSLVLRLREQFPGAELVFDSYSPLHVFVSNLQTARFGFRAHWGIWHGEELERWAAGIRLLDEWCYLDRPEPRLGRLRYLRPLEALFRTLRIYHLQLGNGVG